MFARLFAVASLIFVCAIYLLGRVTASDHLSAETETSIPLTTHYLPIVFTARSEQYFAVSHDMVGIPNKEVDRVILNMQAAGVRSVRMPFRWTLLEPQEGNFKWAKFDRVVSKLIAADIEVIGIFGTVPTWANGKDAANVPTGVDPTAFPPTDPQTFLRMVEAVSQRYRGQVAGWVIFNEPNIDKFWQPTPDASEYVRFLCAGFAAIRQHDPDVLIIGGGLAGNGASFGNLSDPNNFLPKMYHEGAKPCFDVLAIHPYMHPTSHSHSDLQQWIDETRTIMRDNDDFRPIWINEIGWSDAPNAWGLATVSEEAIATWLTDVYSNINGVERIYWYNFRDVAIGADPEFHFGLLRHDFSPKPAFDAFQELAK